jgi:hypothetical protein
MRRRLGLALAGAALGATLFAPGAFAASPDEACWGVVSAQLAQASGGLGSHTSAQSEPRLGLGNVARLFLGDDAKVYELGTLLASIDGLAETSCG